MSLSRIEESLLVATYFRGRIPKDDHWTSSSDQIVTLSLFYTGDITAEECVDRFSVKSYMRGLYTPDGELEEHIRTRYYELIRLVKTRNDLIVGAGGLDRPADPTFTACGLTDAGLGLISSLIQLFPPKPDFPNWPDRRSILI
ncbi:MAG: hypothetical protein U0929_15455 [Planctomycetaceae bacterium]